MQRNTLLLIGADALLAVHALFVGCVVFGLVLILIGGSRGWRWVRNPWFRVGHLTAIAFVTVQSWLGLVCPLTTWEMALRARAGDATYPGTFIAHWLEAMIYYRAPAWVFVVCYTAFATLVVASWVFIRPRPFKT